jgi:hypothetical protein
MAGDRSSKSSKPKIRGSDPTLVAVRSGEPRPRRARGDEPTLMAPTSILLFRPVDEAELAKIEQNGYRRFPPGAGALVVYAYEKYARSITGAGWLTRFSLPSNVISKYPRDGASPMEHYLIPPGDLEAINDALIGPIVVLRSQ